MKDAPPSPFARNADPETIEASILLAPKFDADGLVVAIAVDARDGETFRWSPTWNREALARTIETGDAWFWSDRLWRKGRDSGNTTLAVAEVRVDCDQGAVLPKVRVGGDGVTCHRGYRSCSYRSIPLGAPAGPDLALVFDDVMPRAAKG